MEPFDLPHTAHAAGLAREHLRHVLSATAGAGTIDIALLLTSELVTNAVRHGAAPLRVGVSCTGTLLRVEVTDAAPALPVLGATHSATSEDGRGMLLVDALASAWGVRTTPHAGKVTWFELGTGVHRPDGVAA